MSQASIVLLTYNGEKYLRQALEMIQRQKLQPLEVLAFDSESDDSTPDILQEFEIRTHKVKRSEFSHPGTRNLAAASCSGKYVVFLTQDAVPADSCWLDCLIQPFKEFTNVAGTFSRQIPRPGTSLLEANDLQQDFPRERFVKKITGGQIPKGREIWKLIKFSNASSAYDRRLLLENPFSEVLEMAEDQEWAKRMLEQNYTLIYETASVVLHSHEHILNEKYDRSLKMGRSFSEFLRSVLGRRSVVLELGAWFVHIILDWRYITTCAASFKMKFKWIILSPIHRAVMHYAYRKGWNSAKSPNRREMSSSMIGSCQPSEDRQEAK